MILHLNWLTLVACLSSICYIVFLSDRNVLNFIVGFISSTTYIIVAFNAKLYGEVIFYLIIDLPMIFISYFMWKKHLESALRVSAKQMNKKQILIALLISIASVVGYSFLLKSIGGVNYIVDVVSTVVSFIATLLMAKRYREQWFMWIVVYIVSVIMWITTFDLLMLIMSISCLISCIIGYINWSINARKDKDICV
jgi:nicotinamide mononucleotide transporter